MYETSQYSNALTALARFNEWYNTAENNSYPFAMGGECQNVSYTGMLQSMQVNSADRQWYWQTCNEFGFYQTAENVNVTLDDGEVVLESTAFSSQYVNLDFYVRQCTDLFNVTGEQVSKHVERTNAMYGGWHVSTNRTIFSNGLIDPWHTMSVINDTQLPPPAEWESESLNLVNLIGPTSHCQDIGMPRRTDIPQLSMARYRNVNQMSLWLTGEPLPSSSTALPPPPPPYESSGGSSSSGGLSPSGSNNTSNTSSSSSSGTDNGGGGSDNRRSSMSSGAVVGIVVFAVLVGVVAMAAAVWWWRKRKVSLGGGGSGVGYHEDGLTTGYSSLLGSDARSSA